MSYPFNIRVYGILIDRNRVLVSDELVKGRPITKFPGGGLEYGEGLKDCLARELREELGITALRIKHFYTTDFFQQSAFHDSPNQVIGVYYLISVMHPERIETAEEAFQNVSSDNTEVFRWVGLSNADESMVTLPIDRVVFSKLLNEWESDTDPTADL